MTESLIVDRALLERVAAALAAYMGAMRADIPARETIMERIRSADRKAQPAYAELYAVLSASLVQGTEATEGGGATAGVPEVAAPSFDVEAMLKTCVPGGSICDPQQVADSIRAYFAAGVPAVDPAQAFTEPGERRWSRVLVVLSEAMEQAVRAFDTGTADDYGKACIAFDDAVAAELDRITSGAREALPPGWFVLQPTEEQIAAAVREAAAGVMGTSGGQQHE
jgi:hypothetical protein